MMRRFVTTFKIPIINTDFFIHIVAYRDRDMHTALCSGLPFKEPQYLIMDYDERYKPNEWQWITWEYDYKRALIVESSPKKYWYLTFSPSPIGIIAEIMFNSQCDKNHAQYLLKKGYVAIRLSSKKKGYPRIIKEITNFAGTNFYNWDMERLFRQAIEEGIDVEQLIKKGVERK